MLGFYVTGHPLDQYEDKVRELATHSSGNLEGLEKGVEVALCGVITGVQRKRNREGKPWASMMLEDREGAVDALLFTTNYERLASSLVEDQAVLVRGLVLPEENAAPKVSVQDIVPLEVARIPLPSLISIRVWIGKNGGVGPGVVAERSVPAQAGRYAGAAAPGIAARFHGDPGCPGKSAAGPRVSRGDRKAVRLGSH